MLYMKMEHARDTVTWLQIAKVQLQLIYLLLHFYFWETDGFQILNKVFQNLGFGRKGIAQRPLAILFEKQFNHGGRFPVFIVFVSILHSWLFRLSRRRKDVSIYI